MRQTFISIAIKDFAKKKICDGHLYLRSKEGRRFYVLKPGIFLDNAFIKKHATLNTVFDFLPVTNSEVTNNFLTLFKELRYLQFEKDLRVKSLEIVKYFQKVFSSDEHFLSFVLACFEEFSLLPQEVNSKIHEIDLHLFRKAIYAGAFAVITAITNNFYDYTVIRDFYNLTMCLDIGLCETNYSYFVAEACNQENQRPGTGRLYLEQERASSQEIDVFLKHPEKSYAFFKKSKSLLAYPELAEVALYQHELSSGLGFPRGIPKGLVSNWEAVVILADSLVEIRNEYTFETDIVSYILKFQSSKMSELPVQRVYNKLCMSLEYCSRIRETGT